jgi:hypothetical protein
LRFIITGIRLEWETNSLQKAWRQQENSSPPQKKIL